MEGHKKKSRKSRFYIAIYTSWLERLTPFQALVLGLVYGLSFRKGFCTASDEYLLRKLGSTNKQHLNNTLQQLENMGYIGIGISDEITNQLELIDYTSDIHPELSKNEDLISTYYNYIANEDNFNDKEFRQTISSDINRVIHVTCQEPSGIHIKVWSWILEEDISWINKIILGYLQYISHKWARSKGQKYMSARAVMDKMSHSNIFHIQQNIKELINLGLLKEVYYKNGKIYSQKD